MCALQLFVAVGNKYTCIFPRWRVVQSCVYTRDVASTDYRSTK